MSAFYLYRHAWRYDGAPHCEPKLQEKEWKTLLGQGGFLVRNTYNFDCKEETTFWYVIKDQYQGLDELPSRVRNKIRHAFNNFEYRPIPFKTVEEQVYPIVEETFSDYAVHDRKMNREIFGEYLKHCKERSFDYWGIFDKTTQELVGFCTVQLWDKCCEYGLTGILSKYKKSGYYPYYGLYQHLNQHYLENLHYEYVSDSARTITQHSDIQDFLIRNFNFRKAYCHLDVHYRWWMKVAVAMLYPFRKIIILPRVRAILNMEAMRRGEK